jgi:hypothetical protein
MKGYPTKGVWPAEKRAERGPGYVYLIRPVLGKKSKWFKDKELCPVKIGVSRDNKNGVDSRLKSLGSGNWNELCIELCKYYKTWDNYALSIIILKIMNKVKPNEPKYTKLLKDIIKSTPDKRLTVESTQTKLLQSKL